MTNEDQIAALFAHANPVPSLDVFDQVEPLDTDPLQSRSRRSSVMAVKTDKWKVPARWPRLVWLVAVSAIAAVGLLFLANRNSDVASPSTSAIPSTTVAPSTTASPEPPIDTTTWPTYQSERYGFSIGHPSDWTVTPVDHDWTLEADADDWKSTGQEVLVAPSQGTLGIIVSAWSVALDPGMTLETSADVEAWIEQYCQLARPTCTGFNDRVVPLCLERRDCHPGLLVPFDTDTQAFFPGSSGNGWDRMVAVALWRIESDPSTAPYGGTRRLLEAFLSTMDVYPARPDQIP